MRISGSQSSSKAPDSAPGITRFPSADLWEDPWEPNFDLHALRKRSGKILAAREMALRLRPDLRFPGPTREHIEALNATLGLPDEQAGILCEDTWLIAQWYHLPELGKELRLGSDQQLAQLREAGRYAESLHTLLGGIATYAEDLADGLKIELKMVTPDRSLMTFADEIGSFAIAAREMVKIMKPARRPRQHRRNLAIVLASQAIEEAADVQITTGRDSKDRDGEHFTNAPGWFLAKLMHLICRSSEAAVAGAFIDLRRQPEK